MPTSAVAKSSGRSGRAVEDVDAEVAGKRGGLGGGLVVDDEHRVCVVADGRDDRRGGGGVDRTREVLFITTPIASAPASTATRAASTVVSPHTFTYTSR